MTIQQPTYPITTSDLVAFLGGFSERLGGFRFFENAGHSIANGGGARYFPEGSYPYRAMGALGGARFKNYAIGGAICCWPNSGSGGDGGFGHILRNVFRPGLIFLQDEFPYQPSSQIVNIHYGINDLPRLGSLNPLPYQTSLRTIMARFCAATVFDNTHSAWAYTGTWASLPTPELSASNTAADITYTLTANDKATLTIPANYPGNRVIGIGLWMNALWPTTTIGVKVDGVARPDVAVSGLAICDQSVSAKHNVHTLRLGTGVGGDSALAAGTHTIELTFKSGTGMCIDSAHVETDPLDGPIIIRPLTSKPLDYSLWNGTPHGPDAGSDPMTNASIDAWKSAEQAINAEFPNRVIEIDVDALGLTSNDYISDGVHPNDKGHGKIAAAIYDAAVKSGLFTSRVKTAPAVNPRPTWKQVSVHNNAGKFATGWSNYGVGNLSGFMWSKSEDGRINVRGTVKAAAGATGSITQNGALPKPAANQQFMANLYDGTNWSTRAVQLSTNGVLAILGSVITTAGNYLSFSFSYEPEAPEG